MQFHRSGDRFIALNVTARRHNYLALRFGGSGQHVRVWSPWRERGERLRVNAGDVKQQVLAGVVDAEVESGRQIGVAEIHYLESDTPSDSVYRTMARHLVLRALERPDAFDGRDDSTTGGPA